MDEFSRSYNSESKTDSSEESLRSESLTESVRESGEFLQHGLDRAIRKERILTSTF